MAKQGVSGGGNIRRNLKEAEKKWIHSVATGAYLAAGNIMTRSKRLVPVDLGALKGSGYVTLPEVSGSTIKVELGYGGPAKDYAVKQHEDLTLNHPDGGQARYLAQAAEEHEPALLRTVQTIAKQAFEAGGGRPAKGPLPTDPDKGGSET